MSKKFLPIKFFEKRKDYDDRFTEGGGDSRMPNWVLKGENLKNRAAQLNNDLTEINNEFAKRKSKKTKLPLVVTTTIEEKAIAKSHRGDITSLYCNSNASNILGFQGNRNLLSMITDEDVLSNMGKRLADMNNSKLISSITAIEPFSPNVDSYDSNVKYYKVRLVNYNNYDLNRVSKLLFEKQCVDNGVKIEHKTKFTPDMTIYRVSVDSAEELDLLS